MKIKTDLAAQAAFVNVLRDGYTLLEQDIISFFDVTEVEKFVAGVVDRTGLDIRKAKMLTTQDAVWYLAADLHLETAGLENIELAVEGVDPLNLEIVEHQDGHYLMWVCPATTDFIKGEYCGQFHKVDLGDESLTRPTSVRCVQCGNEYQVKPRT